VLPVAELCRLARGRGIVSVVDGAQAVGVLDFRIDALGCDLYAGSLHKWLGAPYGTGFLYVREEQRARLWPSVVEGYDGWDRYERYGGLAEHPAVDFGEVWPQAMLKYATNLHYYGPLFWSVPLALRLQQALGRSAIEARARSLAARLRQGLLAAGCAVLTPEPAALSAGIVSFRPPRGSTEALKQALRKDGIVVRTVVHAPIGFDVDRACAHWFNTPDEVERLLAGVRSYLAGA
jgi:isopenicillin-N epimerase